MSIDESNAFQDYTTQQTDYSEHFLGLGNGKSTPS